jgi:hypothetical protein
MASARTATAPVGGTNGRTPDPGAAPRSTRFATSRGLRHASEAGTFLNFLAIDIMTKDVGDKQALGATRAIMGSSQIALNRIRHGNFDMAPDADFESDSVVAADPLEQRRSALLAEVAVIEKEMAAR